MLTDGGRVVNCQSIKYDTPIDSLHAVCVYVGPQPLRAEDFSMREVPGRCSNIHEVIEPQPTAIQPIYIVNLPHHRLTALRLITERLKASIKSKTQCRKSLHREVSKWSLSKPIGFLDSWVETLI